MAEATFEQMMWNNAGEEYRNNHPEKNPWPNTLIEDPAAELQESKLVYEELEPGAPWLVDKDTSLYVACCDCGLVHRIDITDMGTQYKLEFWRDDEESVRVRALEQFSFQPLPVATVDK